MISLIIPFAGSTADLVPDLAAATAGAEVVAVDNASDEATQAAIRDVLTPAVTITNARNKGFALANNQGYARASGDVIIFLNSDVTGSPLWLRAAQADIRDGALYGPSLAQQLVYGMWLPYLEGWCLGATRATWERIAAPLVQRMYYGTFDPEACGPWDAAAYPGPYWEDNDLCLRAAQAGVSLVQTGWGNYLQHKGGRTAGAIVRHGESFERNRATFAARVRGVWEAQHEPV